MQRRSTARSTPRKRYTVDAFEGVEELRGELSDDEDPVNGGGAEDEENSDEFQDGNDEAFDDEPISAEPSDVSDVDPVDNDEVADDDVGSTIGIESNNGDKNLVESRVFNFEQRKRRSRQSKMDPYPTYTRGLPETMHRHLSSRTKEYRQLYHFGPEIPDYEPVLKARARWGQDTCFPSRTSEQDGSGGLRQSFFMDQDDKSNAIEADALWLHDGTGKTLFNKRQICDPIDDKAEQNAFTNLRTNSPHAVVMGPVKSQQKYEMSTDDPMKLTDVWKSEPQEDFPPSYKNGYVLNVGSRVFCVDWAANQLHTDQYLAVSTLPLRVEWDPASDEQNSPAFAAQIPQKSSFQIWKLTSTAEGHIDPDSAPCRVLVVCTDWGYAKVLKWAPLYPKGSPQAESGPGLLAGIWGDGAIRVINLDLSSSRQDQPMHLRIRKTAFSAQPPNTVCTCLTWINSKYIAAGCANGCIAVWNLESCLKSGATNPRPMIYTSVSTSLILSIASCAPSRPNILVTSSMTGYMTLTDITRTSQPLLSHASTIFSQRSRFAQSLLLWHESSQTVMQVEENFSLRGSSLRRFFRTVGLGKYKSHGTCIAGSPIHPFILTGTASGEVVSLNPIRRVLDGKTPIWQQTWFSHEWRRPTEAEVTAAAGHPAKEPGEGHAQNSTEILGLTRILEGQKAEQVILVSEPGGKSNEPDTLAAVTTYEERTAITAVAWNPNPHVGGWAAAGCADGFLRIEDLAI